MSCVDLFATLQMYVDGVTDEEETRLAEAHLAECAACRERVEGWRRVVKSLEGLGPVQAPEGFAHRVMDAVRRSAGREPARSFAEVGQEERPLNVSWTWAAAALLMVGVGLVLWLGPEGSAAASAARGLLQFVTSLFGR